MSLVQSGLKPNSEYIVLLPNIDITWKYFSACSKGPLKIVTRMLDKNIFEYKVNQLL